ncbi:MAG TPA: UdgX family uracil-DNA binding protein [Gammaproteobacteria bacterium]|nr:UdgX family uracil-DNA binding protein [Gammaproteobacteria bacterium]
MRIATHIDGRSGARRSAAQFLPEEHSLAAARRAAAGCRGCSLWRAATQTVFGAGKSSAPLMLVGETPGDQEDLAGKPFVGPAGRLLDQALAAARIDRSSAYVTNVVKHFKWEPRGKRRLHRRPDVAEVNACMPWLEREIEIVQPRVVVCLGATAGRALLGRDFLVTRDRGRIVPSPFAPRVLATIHPSALLRLPDSLERTAGMEAFIEDLRIAGRALASAETARTQ